MGVLVRPFEDGDTQGLKAVLDAVYGADPRLRALHEGGHGPPLQEPLRRTLVAERDGGVVAAGTVLESRRHPSRTYLSLDVAPAFRRQGIGTALLGELRQATDRPLATRGRYDEEGAMGFLRRHGFGVLNRCYEGRFDPAAVPPPGASLDAPTLDEAAEFFERWYRQTHWWDPPEPWPLERARQLFCGESLVVGSLVGVRRDGSLVGAAELVRPPAHDPGDELYLVWIGTIGANADIAGEMLGACAGFAAEAGKVIRFEVDESNASVWTALDALGVLGEPVFGIFAEDADTGQP